MSEWHPIEEFDPTWPYRFKWGYSAQQNKAHAWRTADKDGDGRLSHRQEFAQTFGHPALVRAGDQLGIASYIPETRMYDGTLVAPPEIQIHTYYGQQPHDKVYEFFLSKFPDVAVRRAQIGKKMAAENDSPKRIYWTWSPPDIIMGHKLHGGKSWTGEALIGPGVIVVEADRPDTPQEGLGKLKVELIKEHPDANVVLPTPAAAPSNPSFLEREHIEQRHKSALQWAETVLPISEELDEPLTVEQAQRGQSLLKKLFFGKTAADGADLEGAMVGIWIPIEVAKKIKVRGGEPPERMHITLAYFKDKAADRDDWDEVKKIVETIANNTAPMTGKVGGVGVFQNEDGDVLWASPSVPGLVELQQKIQEAVEDAGFPISKEHGWVPHITLKYKHKGKLPRVDADLELRVENISFAQGDKHEDFDLKGQHEKYTSWEMTEWSWPGTQRFVTDGKEILFDPEDQAEWKSTALDDLQGKFRRIYPEAKKNLVSGWAIPTADDMGYGVWAPKVGYGNEDELGLHELITKLDKELGKPTHLVEEWGQIVDPKMYASTHPK